MTQRLEGKVDKGWGYEIIWATNDKYAGKVLVFEKVGAKFSMHFHKEKDETWFINAGQFKLIYCDTTQATYHEKILNEGDTWRNPPMMPHQLIAMKPNSMLFEVSTPDSVEDNYRIIPGDSQNVPTEPIPESTNPA
jgi:mannose-6-phosphate isomerase-like protein (cupin superfamily)